MAMPLVGSPPPARVINYDDLLTGTSSTFQASNGNWTNSGGTLTHDSTIAYMWPSNNTGSAKLVTTSSGQYLECPVPGTFATGVEYQATFVVTVEEDVECDATLSFGLIGTDAATFTMPSFGAGESWNGGRHVALIVRWIPTGSRTGVKVRLTRDASPTGTVTYHVAYCKVHRALPGNYIGVLGAPSTTAAAPRMGLTPFVETGQQGVRYGAGSKSNGGFTVDSFAGASMTVDSTNAVEYAGVGIYDGNAWIQAARPTAGADLTDEGINLEAGTDFIGMTISERDSNTLQLYADQSAGYMMQLRNRGSGKGWGISDDGTTNQKITDTFQWAFYVTGAQTTGTDKAAYFQTPEKARIDEVRIHLGTAPTGATFIVDVNDDGTTIFTTQSNRPTIAISATDATSGTPNGGTAVAKNSVLTIDVDQIGSTIAGSDLVVFVRGRIIW